MDDPVDPVRRPLDPSDPDPWADLPAPRPAVPPAAGAGVNPPWQVRSPSEVTGASPAPGGAVAQRRSRPVVTFVLIGLCVLVHVWQRLDPSVDLAWDFSALGGYLEPWRFVTAAFLHSTDTFSHLLFNMLSLYAMGQFLEPALGRARYLAVYLLGAVGGSVGCLLLTPHLEITDQAATLAWTRGVLGASGAIFALFTAVFLVLRRVGAPVTGMVVLLLINAALPLIYPNIAWQAHLGGAVVGLVATGVVLATAGDRRRWTWPALAGIGVLLLVLVLGKYAANLDELRYVTTLLRP